MKPCKRIEIVIEEPLMERMANLLRDLGAPGYTVLRRVSGMGDRGLRRADEPTGTATNCVFVIACDPAAVDALVAGIRPMLSKFGGVCLVSDAHWLRH
jgi:nitrogen regulatory protein PII